MQGSSHAGRTAGRGGYIRSGMPDRGLPFQPSRDPKAAVEAQRAQDPAKPRRITSLGDIHVSRAYAVGERYRHRNDGGDYSSAGATGTLAGGEIGTSASGRRAENDEDGNQCSVTTAGTGLGAGGERTENWVIDVLAVSPQ